MPDTENTLLTDLGRRLVSGSFSDPAIQRATEATPNFAILPWVNVVKIGGQTIMDGAAAWSAPWSMRSWQFQSSQDWEPAPARARPKRHYRRSGF